MGAGENLNTTPTGPLRAAARIAFRLPGLARLKASIHAQRDQLMRQCLAIERERNELAAHCQRLNRELAEGHAREERLQAEIESLLDARDALERERDELLTECRVLARQPLDSLGAGTPQEQLLQKMRRDWDERARLNAAYYTNTATAEWDDESYFATGEVNVSEHLRSDMANICRGDDPKQMRVLEIGCGAGRMTKALAGMFGEVHAVDISAEMIGIAQRKLSGIPNAFVHQNNGMDLSVVPDLPFDFAFSFIVFQHIRSAEIIEGYVKEVHRLLRPGRLFKFQVQGYRPRGRRNMDTWLGADFTVADMQAMASRCGFEMRHWTGDGTQYFWLWFFRK